MSDKCNIKVNLAVSAKEQLKDFSEIGTPIEVLTIDFNDPSIVPEKGQKFNLVMPAYTLMPSGVYEFDGEKWVFVEELKQCVTIQNQPKVK